MNTSAWTVLSYTSAKSLFLIFHFTPDAIIYWYIFLLVEFFLQYKGGTVNISL